MASLSYSGLVFDQSVPGYTKAVEKSFVYLIPPIHFMKNFLTACLSLILFASCNKEVQELPPATQTGANTFGAKVDGEFWVPKAFGPINANTILEVRILGGQDYHIHARNFASSPTETEFEFFLTGVTAPGTYLLNTNVNYPSLSASFGYFIKRKLTPLNEWITSSSHTGSVTITKVDLTTRIIAGTFQFTAADINDPSKQITISEGRFDLKIP